MGKKTMTDGAARLTRDSATSTGHALSAADWLDTHFLAGQCEYETMLRAAGFQAGWCVLDAGCGGGSFLPLLSELLGENGRINAVDLAPENVSQVERIVESGRLQCPVSVREGDVTALSFDDGQFDGVWSANVTQYLPDAELDAMLAETRRVLKPGGLLAVKDTEDCAFRLHPIPSLLLWRLFDALAGRGEMTVIGGLRALHLSHFVREAGFVHVRHKVTYIERQTPLRPVEEAFIAGLVEWLAQEAESLVMPASEMVYIRACCDPSHPLYMLRQPGLYWREANVLLTGYKAA
ncbi:MAG: class I SAM-dependent methyltransferase [Caldilineaceae bacterium]|nr:class I SAM-dependent methyltransferase [Caldilineaceae bacterium]